MDKLVVLKNNNLLTTSEIVAEGVEKEHKTLMNLITKYYKEISHFGILNTVMRKNKKGHPTEFYYLNEEQVTFLITLMRNDPKNNIVINFKIKIVEQFFKMRKQLLLLSTQKVNQEWIETRKKGKLTRLNETDVIKKYIEYAIEQGSETYLKRPKLAYSNITKMENKALFILEQIFPNVREMLDVNQLDQIKQADSIVLKALSDGMNENMPYKDIYQLAKGRIELFVSLIGKSIVPNIEFKELKPENER